MSNKNYSFEAQLQSFDNSNLWYFYIMIPDVVSQELVKTSRRVLATLNTTITFPCALMPDGNGQYFININKEIRTKLKASKETVLTVSIVSDTSEYGMPMPEELAELLLQDEEGQLVFDKLTPGKKRTLIYLVGKVKSSDIRITKSIKIINYLKSVNGKLDFKELNEALKN
jgi:hypothetical protein